MRSYYDSKDRERSRDRESKDRAYYGRDVSPDVININTYSSHQFAKKKRIKFNDQDDIRVFKKEDQPISKNMTDDDILEVKSKIQKEISRLYDFNWDQKKHFDALSEQNSMKEQKLKEKEFTEKLMGMKQQMEFYPAFGLVIPQWIQQMKNSSNDSIEKDAHTERIKDILGCYYTQVNEIPNEPIFEVTTACNKNEPKIIKFHQGGVNDAEDFARSKNKNQKHIRGILKTQGQPERKSQSRASEPRQISPRLIWLLKDMQVNKTRYNKQMTEMLLKPFQQSGQLDYLMKNQNLLTELLSKQPTGVQPPPSNIPINPVIVPPTGGNYPPMMNRMSPSPHHQFKPQFQPYDPNLKTQKFKTVPCKYFHSPQGCVKTQNCTFIHDERYRGQSLPYMNRAYQPNTFMGQPNRTPNYQYQDTGRVPPQRVQQPQYPVGGYGQGQAGNQPQPYYPRQNYDQQGAGQYQQRDHYQHQQQGGYRNYGPGGHQQQPREYGNTQRIPPQNIYNNPNGPYGQKTEQPNYQSNYGMNYYNSNQKGGSNDR